MGLFEKITEFFEPKCPACKSREYTSQYVDSIPSMERYSSFFLIDFALPKVMRERETQILELTCCKCKDKWYL